jgi:hypothetical protein
MNWKYPNYDDLARFEYGRMLWKVPRVRARLLAHWTDPRHPYAQRFSERRSRIEWLLTTDESEDALDARLRNDGTSLRAAIREIPPVFGSFY